MKAKSERKKVTTFKTYSSFDRKERVGEFKVDNIAESIIDVMNNELINVNEFINKKIEGPSYPSIIITGVPRSGTTLISQLLPARYDLGYVSNLMARFYGSPLLGAWLQQQLMPKDIHFMRKFSSKHGVTKKIYEPHEFGFFWANYLRLNSVCHEPIKREELDNINFSALNTVLSSISAIFNRPVVYKCSISPFIMNTLLCYTNMFFIHIKRERQAVIDSILRVREQRLGNKSNWWSIRPYGWDNMHDKSPSEQVAWQYDQVINSIQKGSVGYENRVCNISLEELIRNPESILEYIMRSYGHYSETDISKVGTSIKLLQKNKV